MIVSDGIAVRHFRETRGSLFRPKQDFLFDGRYRADDFNPHSPTQGDTPFALG